MSWPHLPSLASALSCQDHIDHISFEESGQLEDRVAVAGNILKSTEELRSLALAFDHTSARNLTSGRLKLSNIARASPLQTNLLFAADLSHLEALRFDNLYFHGADFQHLLAALSQCSPTLQLLDMSVIYITGIETREGLGWPDVFRILALMPKLKDLMLDVLGIGAAGYDCAYVVLGGLCSRAVDCSGRSEVVAAVKRCWTGCWVDEKALGGDL